MGFNKKSLLALVLALVMVLGMAVPTAFAADLTSSNLVTIDPGTQTVTQGESEEVDVQIDTKAYADWDAEWKLIDATVSIEQPSDGTLTATYDVATGKITVAASSDCPPDDYELTVDTMGAADPDGATCTITVSEAELVPVPEPVEVDGKIYSKLHGEEGDAAADAAYPLTMADGAVQYDLFADEGCTIPFTSKVLGQMAKFTVENDDTDIVTVVTGDGFIKVTPVGMSYGTPAEVYIAVDSTDGDWDSNEFGWEDDQYFDGTIKFDVAPSISYAGPGGAKKIMLDTYIESKLSEKIVIASNPSGKPVKVTGVEYIGDAEDFVGYRLLNGVAYLDAKAVGEGKIEITATVDGVEDVEPIEIDFAVGDSTPGEAYQIKPENASYSFDRNAKTADLFFDSYIYSAAGTKLSAPKGTIVGDDVTVEFVADDSDSVVPNDSDGTDVMTFSVANGGRVSITIDEDIVSAKGKVVVKKAGVLSGEAAITIKPVNLTTGLSSGTLPLEFSLDPKFTSTRKTASLSLTSTHATSDAALATNKADFTVVDEDGEDAKAMFSFTAGTKTNQYTIGTVANAIKAGTYTLTVVGTVGDFTTESKEIKLVVTDKTPKPAVAYSVTSPITLDLRDQTPSKKSQEITLTASNFIGDKAWESIAVTAEFKSDDDGALEDGSLTIAKVDNTKAKLTLTGKTRGTGTLTFTGKINDVAIDKKVFDVVIDDSTPNQPHHFVVTPDSVEVTKKLTDATYQFDAKMADYSGVTISGSIGNLVAESDDTDVATINANDVNGKFTVTFLKAGEAVITLKNAAKAGATIANVDKVAVKKIKLTITAPTFTTTPSKDTGFVVDLKDATADDPIKVEIKLSSTEGAITGIEGATAYAVTPVGDDEEGTLTLEFPKGGLTAKRQKLTVSCKVGNYAAEDIVIPFEVKDTRAIIADPTEFAFEIRDGGIRDGVLTLAPNPDDGVMVITNIASSNPEVVKVTETEDEGVYDVEALTAGKGAIIVKGTVNGSAVEDVSVPFTVVDTMTKPELIVTPSGDIKLDMTDKPSVTLNFTSDFGTVTDLKVVPADASVVSVVTTGTSSVITALKDKAGTKLTVTGKASDIDCTPLTINVTVGGGVVPPEAPVLIDGKPATGETVLTFNGPGFNRHKVEIFGLGNKFKYMSSNKAILKLDPATTASSAAQTVNGTNVQWFEILKAGKVTVTVTPDGGQAIEMKFDIKALAEQDFTVAGDMSLLVGQRASAKPAIVPAEARSKGFKYKSDKKGTVSVNSKGVMVAKKAGTAVITVTSKKKPVTKKTFTVTVTNDLSKLNYNSVVLLQNTADGKTNHCAADLEAIFKAARFDANGIPASADVLAPTATKAEVKAAITAMAEKSVNAFDISNFYFAGEATADGMKLGTEVYSFTELANDLAACTGNVVVFLDCKGGNRMLNAKAASDSDIFAAFSKAAKVKSALNAMDNAGVEKLSFTVFTATKKKGANVTITANADGTSADWKFTEKLVGLLKADPTGNITVGGADKLVTVKELWAKLKSAKGAVWSSSASKLTIYGAVAPATPAP